VTMHLPQFEDETPSTRTLIEVSSSDQISYKWGVGDVLGIYPDAGTQVAFELSASSLSADGLSATFDGGAWALKGGHSYYAYFPFSYDCFSASVNKTNIPISYLGQKQSAFGDTSNAGQFDFNAAGPTSSSTGSLSFNFVRLGALLRVKFTLPATATYKTLTLNTGSSVIPVKGTVNLAASSIAFTPKEYSSSLSVDLNNASGTVGQTAYVYMMLPPMSLKTQGKTMTVTLSYGDDKSTTYNICTAGTTTENTPDFKANTRYKRDAVYVSGDPEGTMSGGDDEEEPNMNNGHAYVDLGLPSGLKWATMNVGATTPEGYGDYFAWGETEPYYTAGHSQADLCSSWKTGKTGYNWESYKWCNGSYNTQTKYCTSSSLGTVDDKTTLESADDAAAKNWGGSWRMPTKAEQDELRTNCTWTCTVQNGVSGCKVSSKINGNSLFLPAAGFRLNSDLDDVVSYGYYWSSSLLTSFSSSAYYLGFDSEYYVDWSYNSRHFGHSVRAVCP
ncbi:MAG: hypothetical protein KBT33_13205, partial [Prevotellaceae bacterium]|nr:hypothetical protein [Candidatus Minthosoma equi]